MTDTKLSPDQPGLRERKKCERRRKIMAATEQLISSQGFEATTITQIAGWAGVSKPTVLNYFSSKENILNAILAEGTAHAREAHSDYPRSSGCEFSKVLTGIFTSITGATLTVAGKRAWRYAEAAYIRRPHTEFEQSFAYFVDAMHEMVVMFLDDYDIMLRSAEKPDTPFLATLLIDRWLARHIEYLKNDPMPQSEFEAKLGKDMQSLTSLLFEDVFATTSPLKSGQVKQ